MEDFFKSLDEFRERRPRKPETDTSPATKMKNHVRSQFLKFLKDVLGAMPFFPEKGRDLLSPYHLLDYEKITLIVAEELHQALWMGVTHYKVEGSTEIKMLWEVESKLFFILINIYIFGNYLN